MITTQPVPRGPMSTEPVITVTTITTLVSAVFAGVVLAAPGIDPQWETIIIGAIAAAWPIVTAVWARSKAYAPSTVQAEVNKAAATGVASDVAPPPPKEPDTPRSRMEREIEALKQAPPERWANRPKGV